jgi:glycosyltransferase involved in cell wall biosynthesis
MAAGALVVSEPVYLPDPYIPGVHYVESSVEDMADTVRRYLADDDARRRITETAHAFVTTELTLARSLTRLVTLASESLSGRGR